MKESTPIGNRPSYAWKSMWNAKYILQEGMMSMESEKWEKYKDMGRQVVSFILNICYSISGPGAWPRGKGVWPNGSWFSMVEYSPHSGNLSQGGGIDDLWYGYIPFTQQDHTVWVGNKNGYSLCVMLIIWQMRLTKGLVRLQLHSLWHICGRGFGKFMVRRWGSCFFGRHVAIFYPLRRTSTNGISRKILYVRCDVLR